VEFCLMTGGGKGVHILQWAGADQGEFHASSWSWGGSASSSLMPRTQPRGGATVSAHQRRRRTCVRVSQGRRGMARTGSAMGGWRTWWEGSQGTKTRMGPRESQPTTSCRLDLV
jgi:hypothetical protein